MTYEITNAAQLAAVQAALNVSPMMSWPKFFAALNRTDRNPTIATVTDSTGAGQQSAPGNDGNRAVNSWPVQLAEKALPRRGYPGGGQGVWGSAGFWGNASPGTGATSVASYKAGDSRLDGTGSAQFGSLVAPSGNAMEFNNAAGTWTFVPTSPWSKLDFWLRDFGAGRDLTWAINGGGTTLISGGGTGLFKKYTISAGSVGMHTVTFTWSAGGVGWGGIFSYDDSRRQVNVFNWGGSGAQSSFFIAAGSPNARHTMPKVFGVDLVLFQGGVINDRRNNVPVATTRANHLTYIQQQDTDGVDIALLTSVFESGAEAAEAAYNDMTYELGAATGKVVLDVRPLLKNYTTANANGLMSDSVHLSTLGAATLADFTARQVTR